MQSWTEFLKENYEMTEYDFDTTDIYLQRIIEKEYDAYIAHYLT